MVVGWLGGWGGGGVVGWWLGGWVVVVVGVKLSEYSQVGYQKNRLSLSKTFLLFLF